MSNAKNIALVIKDAAAIKGIKRPDLETCIAALMQDGMLIAHIDTSRFTRREYLNLCNAAVKSNARALTVVQWGRLGSRLCDSVRFTAVQKNGLALRWIKEQSPELCLEAVRQNHKALACVDKTMCGTISPHCYSLLQEEAQKAEKKASERKTKRAAKTKNKEAEDQEPKIDLRVVDRQTEELCLKAVIQDGLQIQYVHRQTRRLCRAAVHQNPEAEEYIRDNNMVSLNDLLRNVSEGVGGFSGALGNYMFYCISKKTKKVPAALKVKGKESSPSHYYSQCQKALEDNCCNLRHVNPGLLSRDQYRELCILALKEMPDVMVFINDADIDADLYFQICLQMLAVVKSFQLERAFTKIQSARLSTEQYYRIVQVLFQSSPLGDMFMFEFIDAKKLARQQYFELCRDLVKKSMHDFEHVQGSLLTRAQYTELAFDVVKKNHAYIDMVDKNFLAKKDWFELCKMAVSKKGTFLYNLDIPPGSDFNALLEIAGKNGGGLKYISSQDFSRCLAVVKKEGYELEHVRPEQFTPEHYFAICKAAVKKEPRAIGFVDDEALDNHQYFELCAAAQKSFYGIFFLVNPEKIPASLYHSWCRTALKHSPFWIKDIPYSKHYYYFCLKAVKKGGDMLKHIKHLRLSPEEYAALCKAAEENKKEEHDELFFLSRTPKEQTEKSPENMTADSLGGKN